MTFMEEEEGSIEVEVLVQEDLVLLEEEVCEGPVGAAALHCLF